MTRLLLVIPGLIWSAPQTGRPAQDLPLAGLSRLLGDGRRRIEASARPEDSLLRLFGFDGETPPLAALRRLGEDGGSRSLSLGEHLTNRHCEEGFPGPDAGTHWLCADPVNLSLTRECLFLGDFADGEVEASEAAALIAALNRDFPDLGQFSAATPTRWYLRLDRPTTVRFSPLHDVCGRPVQDFLPEGGEASARHWRHILNEIQIALHNHPANEARKATGRRTINSLWFWGASGQPAAAPRAFCSAIQTLDPVARGLARAAGIEPSAPDVDAALRTDTLVVLDPLAAPARRLELAFWRTALAALENDWFAPLAKALDAGRPLRLELFAPGDRYSLSLIISHRSHWRFWRKPFPLDALLAANAPSRPARQTP
ncbi:MAG: hypothetical protein LBR95_05175 [Azoarcus sp.]|jgi:hypothetical protein|nr:hypothetical protein [Azoarcus sp.]